MEAWRDRRALRTISATMAWLYLLFAAACEMAWPIGFKYTNGFRVHYPIIALTMATMLLSFWLMSQSVSRGIHIGTAYAVWTGLGAAGTVILGMIMFKEPRDAIRLTFLVVIIVGVVGLKFVSPPEQPKDEASASGPTPQTQPTEGH
jgi:quaternary ammonium compound-resistance protein SugE